MARPIFVLAGAVVVGCASVVACTAASDPREIGAGGQGATSASATNGGGGLTTVSTGGGSTGIGGGCASISLKAEPIPVDILVMLDQSGSMLEGAGNGLSRWDTVRQAISAFVQEPASAGIGIGLQYFGQPTYSTPGCFQIPCTAEGDCIASGCSTCLAQGICQASYNPDVDSCDPNDYAWAEVPIQPLPGVGPAILTSMGAHSPGTNTPTSAALQGSIDYAKSWQEAHPAHVTIVAFTTDGGPSACDTNLNNIYAIAAAGYGGVPSIRTYVIGVGPLINALDGIAAAGGTTEAFHVDLDPMATQQFFDAMNTIRLVAIGCTYQLPPPPSGMQLDFNLVNVEYTPGDGGPPVTIPKVQGPSQCPADGHGWYYDNNVDPTKIILCAAMCTEVSKNLMAQIDIVLGCQTIVQ